MDFIWIRSYLLSFSVSISFPIALESVLAFVGIAPWVILEVRVVLVSLVPSRGIPIFDGVVLEPLG